MFSRDLQDCVLSLRQFRRNTVQDDIVLFSERCRSRDGVDQLLSVIKMWWCVVSAICTLVDVALEGKAAG